MGEVEIRDMSNDDDGQYWAQIQAEAEAAEAEASMAAEAEYANAMEELAAKQAAAPPRPPIDTYSWLMGRAEMQDLAYRTIEDVMYSLAPKYERGETMSPIWNELVMLKDTLYSRLRENVKQLPAPTEAKE